MSVDRFELVPFGERQILTVHNDDGVFVVMKPVVEALGLNWAGQHQRIARHPSIAKGICVTHIPSGGGAQEAAALKLEHFHAWLVTLHPDRIADADRRAVIIEYQERAFRAVFEHFHGPIGQTPPALPASQRIAMQNQVLRLVKQLQASRHKVERQMMHDMLGGLCRELDLPTPALDRLGQHAPDDDDLVDAFWTAIDELRGAGADIDHSRTPERAAFSLLELQRQFHAAGIGFPIDGRLRAALKASRRFVGNLTVNSRILETSKHCWVFKAAA